MLHAAPVRPTHASPHCAEPRQPLLDCCPIERADGRDIQAIEYAGEIIPLVAPLDIGLQAPYPTGGELPIEAYLTARDHSGRREVVAWNSKRKCWAENLVGERSRIPRYAIAGVATRIESGPAPRRRRLVDR